jgi:hypothetical protein
MERRKHYWNGRMGRLVREDIYVYEDGGTWWVEAREGGSEGNSRWYELPDADRALDLTRDLITASRMDGWKELPVSPNSVPYRSPR